MPVDIDSKDAFSNAAQRTSRVNEFVTDLLNRNRIISRVDRRVLQWQLTTEYAQWQAKRDGLFHGDPAMLEIAGDWQTFARDYLGDTGSATSVEVEQIVSAQAFSEWKFADGSRGNMIVLNVRPRSRGKAARIRIQLGQMLTGWRT